MFFSRRGELRPAKTLAAPFIAAPRKCKKGAYTFHRLSANGSGGKSISRPTNLGLLGLVIKKISSGKKHKNKIKITTETGESEFL